ncbi:MAG: hypothetical protein ACO1OB_28360 [Archangium sp.]
MNTPVLLAAIALTSSLSFAQVQVVVDAPTITFGAPPPLVVVQPGVQVVEDSDDEIYFVDNVYWVRRGPRWYRSSSYRGGWVVVDGPRVPAAIVRLPPGQYRHYKRGGAVVVNPPGPGKVKIKKGKGHR